LAYLGLMDALAYLWADPDLSKSSYLSIDTYKYKDLLLGVNRQKQVFSSKLVRKEGKRLSAH